MAMLRLFQKAGLIVMLALAKLSQSSSRRRTARFRRSGLGPLLTVICQTFMRLPSHCRSVALPFLRRFLNSPTARTVDGFDAKR